MHKRVLSQATTDLESAPVSNPPSAHDRPVPVRPRVGPRPQPGPHHRRAAAAGFLGERVDRLSGTLPPLAFTASSAPGPP